MSYILDALKKSERERALENISTLSPVMPAQSQARSQWLGRGIGLSVLALIGLLLWNFQMPLHQMGQNFLREAKDIVANINLPDLSSESIEKQETAEPIAKPIAEQVAEKSQFVVNNTVPVEPNPVQQPVTPTIKQETLIPEVKKDVSESEPIATVASIENEYEVEPQVMTPSNQSVIEEPRKESEILSLNLAPLSLRQKLTGLSLAAVSYTKDAGRRFVLVNDQMYREGDALPGGVIVEKITRDGMVVVSDDVKVLLRP